MAVTVCWPTLSEAVVNVAFPEELTPACQSTVFPSVKSTMPVGAPRPLVVGVTVAVNVTVCPKTVGLAEDVKVVVVAEAWTSCTSSILPPLKLESPP